MPNWELKHCCDHEQSVFIVTIAVFTVVILALWRTVLLTPFKLITVFLHETSHALACKLTCGDVEGIQVHANEGGVTQTRGGIYWIILPAGYLGSSFWGMVFILASTNLLTTRIAAGCFLLALLVVLFVAKNWLLRGLCIGFIIFLAIVWLLQETTKDHEEQSPTLTSVDKLSYCRLLSSIGRHLMDDAHHSKLLYDSSKKHAATKAALTGCNFSGLSRER